MLGGGRTSRLYRELVEKGVAVSAYAYSMEMTAPGIITVSASPNRGVTLAQVETAAMAVTDAFLKSGPTPEELTRAKRMIAASQIFARDSQMGMANWYGSMLVAGESLDYIGGWADRINAVTTEQAMAALRKHMTGVNHIDATLLPEAK